MVLSLVFGTKFPHFLLGILSLSLQHAHFILPLLAHLLRFTPTLTKLLFQLFDAVLVPAEHVQLTSGAFFSSSNVVLRLTQSFAQAVDLEATFSLHTLGFLSGARKVSFNLGEFGSYVFALGFRRLERFIGALAVHRLSLQISLKQPLRLFRGCQLGVCFIKLLGQRPDFFLVLPRKLLPCRVQLLQGLRFVLSRGMIIRACLETRMKAS